MTIPIRSTSISITDAALVKLLTALEADPTCYIRLGVDRIADRSIQYVMGVDDEMGDMDVEFDFADQSVRVICSLASARYLGDVLIDYIEGAGFKIENNLTVQS